MEDQMTPHDFVYIDHKLGEDGKPVIDVDGHAVYEEKIAEYSRCFTVAQKDGADRYFFLQKGKTVCDDPEEMYTMYHFGGSLIGHVIEAMSRLAQIKRDTAPGFSIGKHWFLLIAVMGALAAIGIVINGYVLRLGY
jgi:hypothetical protein